MTVRYRCSLAPGSRQWFLAQAAGLLLLPQRVGGGAVGIPAWQKLVRTGFTVALALRGREPAVTSD
jgi:hypothetical protein